MPARAQAQAQAEAPLAPVEQKPSRYMGCIEGMHPHLHQHVQLHYKPDADKPDANTHVNGRMQALGNEPSCSELELCNTPSAIDAVSG